MKKILASIIILSVITLNGCWDMREINELGLVMAVAVDKDMNNNDYIITVQIANPQQNSGMGGQNGGGTSDTFFVLTAEGKTLFDATRQLAKVSSKRIMWAHNYIIIIGENLAKDSIIPVVDYFTHNPELRMDTPVVVSEGDAKDYLTLKSGEEEIPAVSFSSIFSYGYLTGESLNITLLYLCQDFYSEDTQPLISMISFKKSKLLPSDVKSLDIEDQVSFGGTAIFDKDKMVGILTPDETKGVAWIFNNTHLTLVTVPEPSQQNKFVSVETTDVKSDITTQIINGKPSAVIDVTGGGSIVEEDAATNLSLNDLKKELDSLVDEQMVNDINQSLSRIQKSYKCDVLGLSTYFHAEHESEWENVIKKDWQSIYEQMPITVNVNINITDSTVKQKPLAGAK